VSLAERQRGAGRRKESPALVFPKPGGHRDRLANKLELLRIELLGHERAFPKDNQAALTTVDRRHELRRSRRGQKTTQSLFLGFGINGTNVNPSVRGIIAAEIEEMPSIRKQYRTAMVALATLWIDGGQRSHFAARGRNPANVRTGKQDDAVF